MPTPVSQARQCLTEEAARALDDAVSVARRRNHAQTTSLHALSALLSHPSSPSLRDACARSRSTAYSPRLQFRALELCVGVSLDRLPSAKLITEPPVSNSLMAAIKRSQANQRRHPEFYQLQHVQQQQQQASVLKVELKHFILSILDDPIVSRVFGEAGFRSCDIKLAIIRPPVSTSSSFMSTRMPPIFLCNLTESDSGSGRGFNFPFNAGGDENSKRIGEVLVRKSGRNPVLVGVCASDALSEFVESVKGGKVSFLPNGLSNLSVEDVSEIFGSKERIGCKLKEIEGILDRGEGSGLVVSLGELKGLVGGGEGVSYVVEELRRLFEQYREKMWLIGAVESYETYSKFLGMFPSVQKDWDLHLLPITSSKPSFEAAYPRSSLMGSFVPFGGFFETPSDVRCPVSNTNANNLCCRSCNEKYEQEVAAVQKIGSSSSVAEQYASSLPSWLQSSDLDSIKGTDAGKAKFDAATIDAKVLGLRKKWNDICQRVHHTHDVAKLGTQAISGVPADAGVQFRGALRENSCNFPQNLTCSSTPSPCTPTENVFPSKQIISMSAASVAVNADFKSKLPMKDWKSLQIEMENRQLSKQSVYSDNESSSFPASVTTDLGIGTIYGPTIQEPRSSRLQVDKEKLQLSTGSVSAENSSNPIAQLPSCSGPKFEEKLDMHDIKALRRALSEKVAWQGEAICAISETISGCQTGNGRHSGPSLKRNVWLTFLGPDKLGKRKMASRLAEVIFGSRENLVKVDLSPQDRPTDSDSIFECRELNDNDLRFRGKTVIDYIAGELSKKPHSVVFLENVDKADVPARSSLSQAIRTGKFPDSHGREININNMIFVATSSSTKETSSFPLRSNCEYSEEKVLGAKNWQMKLSIGNVAKDGRRHGGTNVSVTTHTRTSYPLSSNKRKLDCLDLMNQEKTSEIKKLHSEASRSYLDLNLPVVDMEEDVACVDSDSDSFSEISKSWLEDLFDHVDKNVGFKPFDFDALAENIVHIIGLEFHKAFGLEFSLQIDHEVLVQVLAAAWSAENKALDNWVGQTLGRTFREAKEKFHLPAGSIVELVSCEGLPVKEHAPGVRLPTTINMD